MLWVLQTSNLGFEVNETASRSCSVRRSACSSLVRDHSTSDDPSYVLDFGACSFIKWGGPQYRFQNILILIIGTPKMPPVILGNPHVTPIFRIQEGTGSTCLSRGSAWALSSVREAQDIVPCDLGQEWSLPH